MVDAADEAGQVPTFVVYGIPDRDCSGGFSGGGLPADQYGAWVQEIADAAGDGDHAAVVVEPDALASVARVRQQRGAGAADRGRRRPVPRRRRHDVRRRRPLELGRAGRAGRAAGAGRRRDVRGFATNVANYQTDEDEVAYAEKLSALLGGAHYIIDSGRNGFGSTDDWCNPPGRAFGTEPVGVDRTAEHLDAYVWVKPPAESDGECGGGPPAGEFWPERALELAVGVRLVRIRASGPAARGAGVDGGRAVVSIRPMQPGSDWVAVIIEDDPDVRDLIDIVLTQSGFRTVVTENGRTASRRCATHNPLITTLDVNMPGMDGFAVAKRLREFSSTYLIMITALADEIDVVQGFEAGADDYLVKPFRPRELRARADSMLRRPRARMETPGGWAGAESRARAAPREESWAAAAARDLAAACRRCPAGASPQPQPYQPPVQQPAPGAAAGSPAAAAPAPPARRAAPPRRPAVAAPAPGAPPAPGRLAALQRPRAQQRDPGGHGQRRAVDLTRTEFDLLASLLSTGRRVRSKADLVLTMRGQQYVTSYFVNEADKRSVEVHIANLRRKIGDDAGTPRYIETVRGVGYRLAEAT